MCTFSLVCSWGEVKITPLAMSCEIYNVFFFATLNIRHAFSLVLVGSRIIRTFFTCTVYLQNLSFCARVLFTPFLIFSWVDIVLAFLTAACRGKIFKFFPNTCTFISNALFFLFIWILEYWALITAAV